MAFLDLVDFGSNSLSIFQVPSLPLSILIRQPDIVKSIMALYNLVAR
jgi:hypothetical protein